MTTYRSKETIYAVQFTGTYIPGVTCDGSSTDKDTRDAARYAAGCDSSRAHHLHVHTQETGGMHVLKPGDWVFPVIGGPLGVASDEKFRAHWEVPEVMIAPVDQVAPAEPESVLAHDSRTAPENGPTTVTTQPASVAGAGLAVGSITVPERSHSPDAPIDHVEV